MSGAGVKPKIVKAEGITASERYLARLGEKLFLSLWSYPSVFRNQGNKNGGDGKELCDLLVVFQNHILIFSDKCCSYPDTGVEGRDWCRWFRKSVHESSKQVWGAERWIRENPDRIFLDRSCSQKFPIRIPKPQEMVVHRIVVARTASSRCRKFFKSGSGSLMISPSIQGNAHYTDEKTANLFQVGDIDPSKGFIHVLDSIGLQSVMNELDTAADFIEYLSKREKFLRSGRCGGAAGEEELLAYYLHQLDNGDEHDFVIPHDVNAAWLDEGLWDDYIHSDRRMRRILADEISYTWDRLIERFNLHILNGTYYNTEEIQKSDRGEAIRMLAMERRTARRLLASSLLEHLQNSLPSQRSVRVHLPVRTGGPHYLFLALSDIHAKSQDEYRSVRRKLLEAFCLVLKLKYPDAKDIVGIATEPGLGNDRSEDAIWFDARHWSEELRAEAEALQRDLGLLTQCRPQVRGKEYEFPPAQSGRRLKATNIHDSGKSFRNSNCSCGSGRKYKRCSMR